MMKKKVKNPVVEELSLLFDSFTDNLMNGADPEIERQYMQDRVREVISKNPPKTKKEACKLIYKIAKMAIRQIKRIKKYYNTRG